MTLHDIVLTIQEIAALLGSIAAMVAAVASVLAVYGTTSNRRRIEEVHRSTNGMKDQLVEAVGGRRYAEGVIDGQNNGNGKKPGG